MPTPDLVQQDGLSLEERFFARIALKNSLLTETDLALATRERVASGKDLATVLKARGLLSDTQIAKVREAQAASQIVRLDSLYADILIDRRLVPRSEVEGAFAEQRKRLYKVRIGDLLVEKGQLTKEGHKAVLDALLRKVRENSQDLGSGAERRGSRAEDLQRTPTTPLPRPRPTPAQAPVAIPLESTDSTAEHDVKATIRDRPPIPDTSERPASFLESNSAILKKGKIDDDSQLLASALEIRIEAKDQDVRDEDGKQVAQDRSRIEEIPPVLARMKETASSDEQFSPDAWLERRKRSRRIFLSAGLTLLLAALTAIASGLFVGLGHQHALDAAVELLRKADALSPDEQVQLLGQARQKLAEARGLGVSETRWLRLESNVIAA